MVTELFGDAPRQPADLLLERLRSATTGSYDVAGELGRGGMAVVYVGTDRQLQRRVAIKVMDPRLAMTQGMAERFLQEARIAARLQHPNIIVVHDVRQSDEIIFFVMSLIDGVAVDEICRRAQPVPIDQIRWILLQATRALAYAHSEDIVHRDIKPANILLNLKGDVILTDFGIAKALGDTGLTQSGTQIGTPMYMSPEQFSGVPVGSASDQYALGITAYEMLAGKPPFSGDLYQLIASHGGKTPEPVQNLRPDCPPFLANAVMRMLEKDPRDRWPSLEDLQGVFGANMAMDGGVARRKLAETVRALHLENGGSAGSPSNPGLVTPVHTEKPPTSLVVTISPPGATVFVAGSLELRATVSLDTGQSLPGAGVQWASSNESILRVDGNGQVVGVAPGVAVIRATVNGGYSDATIRVEAAPIARLSMTSPNVTMRVGDVISPVVTAVDVNGVSRDDVAMVWISRTPAIADLDEPGRVRAISPGLAVIDITIGNVRRSIDIAVLRRPITSLRVSVPERTLQLGESIACALEAFDDLGEPADATPARWTSSAPSVIHIDSTGRALAIGPGTARISASVDEASGSIELESLEPAIGSIQLSVAEDHVELGDDITWTMRVKDINGASRSTAGVRVWSSTPDVVAVDDAGQRALALRIGEAVIHAAPEGRDVNDPMTASARVRVTDIIVTRVDLFPTSLNIEAGAVAAVNLQAVDRRGRQVMNSIATWTLDVPDVVVVEGNGIVRALKPGACTITARVTNGDGSVVDSALAVRVRQASIARISIAADRSMLEVGTTTSLRATTWDAMDVEVQDAQPVWKSTHPAIARVESDGRVFALAPGRATIIAELEGKSGQTAILVAPSAVESLSIVPLEDPVVGVAQPLAVSAIDRNGHAVTPEVRWRVEPADAATVSAAGVLTPVRAGAMTVRASLVVPADADGILSANNAIDATLSIQVRAAKIATLDFTTSTAKLAVGRARQAGVRATSESGAVISPSTLVWSSSNTGVVRVNATGELQAISPGESVVTVAADDLHATMTVQVIAGGMAALPMRSMAMAGGVILVAAVAWMAWPSGSSPEQGALPAGGASMTDSTGMATAGTAGAPVSSNGGENSPPATPSRDEVAATETAPPGQMSPSATQTPAPSPPPSASPKTSPKTTTTASPTEARASGDAARPVQRPTTTPSVRPTQSAPVYTPPPAAVVDTPVSKAPVTGTTGSPAATAPVAALEIPSAGDLKTIAEKIANDVRSGKLRTTTELRQFFEYGAEHKVSVGTSPVATAAEQGHVRTKFELALSRYNAAGIPERRITVVTVDVTKRNGVATLESTAFGAIVKPGK